MAAKKKNQKINKLRRVRILPSVLCFIFSFIIMISVMFGVYKMSLDERAEKQVEQASKQAGNFGRLLLDRVEQGESVENILTFFSENSYGLGSVCIVDAKNQPVFGIGEFTCNLDTPWETEFYKAVLYPDTDMDPMFQNGPYPEPGTALVQTIVFFINNRPEDIEEEIEETVYNVEKVSDYFGVDVICSPYWVEMAKLPDGRRILIQSFLSYTVKDLLYCIILAALVAAVFLIPSTFLFGTIISSFKTQARNTRLVFFDPVTEGHNRFYFVNMVGKFLEKKKNARKIYALVDFNMEKYRGYCVFHGTQEGERLLKRMDRFFEKRVNSYEYFAHTENANFALLLRCTGKKAKADCIKRIERWMEELPEALKHSHAVFHVGVCFIGPAGEFNADKSKKRRKNVDVVRLMNNAAAAGAQLEGNEASGISEYGEALLEAQLWEHKVEEMMDDALKNNEFQVYVQPKYDPVHEELVGGEALIRWISPTEGFIGPGKFIPIFEKNGFIAKIDDFMISSVAALQSKWLSEGKKVVPISVNVSRIHFAMPDLAEHICALVDAHQTPHEIVEIELTESAFFDDKKMLLNTVKKLQELGFDVSMDDFGSGYSSLNSLKDMPLNVLKLDAEFFRGESEGNRGEIVVSEAIQLAKNLNMRIVAEGVEKKDQVDFLAGLGCDMIQGFYFAKPMAANEFETRMKVTAEGEKVQAEAGLEVPAKEKAQEEAAAGQEEPVPGTVAAPIKESVTEPAEIAPAAPAKESAAELAEIAPAAEGKESVAGLVGIMPQATETPVAPKKVTVRTVRRKPLPRRNAPSGRSVRGRKQARRMAQNRNSQQSRRLLGGRTAGRR